MDKEHMPNSFQDLSHFGISPYMASVDSRIRKNTPDEIDEKKKHPTNHCNIPNPPN